MDTYNAGWLLDRLANELNVVVRRSERDFACKPTANAYFAHYTKPKQPTFHSMSFHHTTLSYVSSPRAYPVPPPAACLHYHRLCYYPPSFQSRPALGCHAAVSPFPLTSLSLPAMVSASLTRTFHLCCLLGLLSSASTPPSYNLEICVCVSVACSSSMSLLVPSRLARSCRPLATAASPDA